MHCVSGICIQSEPFLMPLMGDEHSHWRQALLVLYHMLGGLKKDAMWDCISKVLKSFVVREMLQNYVFVCWLHASVLTWCKRDSRQLYPALILDWQATFEFDTALACCRTFIGCCWHVQSDLQNKIAAAVISCILNTSLAMMYILCTTIVRHRLKRKVD